MTNFIFSIRTLTEAVMFWRWNPSVLTQGPPDRVVSTQEQQERRGRSNSESILPFIISSVFQAILQRPNQLDSISSLDFWVIQWYQSHTVFIQLEYYLENFELLEYPSANWNLLNNFSSNRIVRFERFCSIWFWKLSLCKFSVQQWNTNIIQWFRLIYMYLCWWRKSGSLEISWS